MSARDRKGANLRYLRQPYFPNGPGELNRGFLSYILPIVGQDHPETVERWRMEHGRDLSGFSTEVSYAAKYSDDGMSHYEKDDDTVGSGIFDAYGHTATVNRKLGVFEDHPSIPGYIAREIQFSPLNEVKNLSSGAAVITVPGGGMSYIDRGHGIYKQFTRRKFDPRPKNAQYSSSLPSVPFEQQYMPVDDSPEGSATPSDEISSAMTPMGPIVQPQLPPGTYPSAPQPDYGPNWSVTSSFPSSNTGGGGPIPGVQLPSFQPGPSPLQPALPPLQYGPPPPGYPMPYPAPYPAPAPYPVPAPVPYPNPRSLPSLSPIPVALAPSLSPVPVQNAPNLTPTLGSRISAPPIPLSPSLPLTYQRATTVAQRPLMTTSSGQSQRQAAIAMSRALSTPTDFSAARAGRSPMVVTQMNKLSGKKKRGLGDDPPPPTSVGSFIVAGLLVGAAAAIFFGTVRMPGRRA